MNKKLCILMSALAASAFTFALKAEAKGCCCPTPQTHSMKPRFYLDVGAGHAFDSQVGSDTLPLLDFDSGAPVDNTFLSLSKLNRASPDNLLIGAGFLWTGLYKDQSPYLPFISLGLQYQYTNFDNKKTLMQLTFSKTDTGQVFASGESNYLFSQNSLLGNLKLDLYRWGHVMPYLNLGLGASWNQTQEKGSFFNLVPPDPNAVITTPTTRTTAFSYNVGAGLDFLVTEIFWLSLGYNYNNFGRVQVGKITNSVTGGQDIQSQPFNLGNLTTHNIQLTGRYVFG